MAWGQVLVFNEGVRASRGWFWGRNWEEKKKNSTASYESPHGKVEPQALFCTHYFKIILLVFGTYCSFHFRNLGENNQRLTDKSSGGILDLSPKASAILYPYALGTERKKSKFSLYHVQAISSQTCHVNFLNLHVLICYMEPKISIALRILGELHRSRHEKYLAQN